ncbi:MBL fold metallo-hydrolase [Alicyclobacillus fastidiosus]|uniref:MBL fold metallo-hydrolase n=1 Tax=Alicyclobacillus fastidiosus TaxID=392011 RepID=A0ABV5ADV4_9BACL|nr:MBL fold metallo-hydrolase [Alicyclobacillus fastidiosus]WEH08546.1 MBL fold metallo-hydrolase [Alicyclobacillus fastidiosus]
MQTPAFPQPVRMTDDIWQIDLLEQGLRYRTGAYVIVDDKPTLIETGSANSHDALLAGLSAVGLTPQDLAYVVVTHVHLDHAGGAGQLMAKAPQAQLVVHPRGMRHMADPSKLWAGAKQVYGTKTEALFGGVVPVQSERILVREHEQTLSVGKRTLQFFDSPGHAKHHFTILSEVDRVLFAGDAVGILYPTDFTGFPFDFIAPSSSPIDFDPAAVHNTLDMLRELPFDWVYHAHFGKSLKHEAIDHTRRLADAFAAMIGRIYTPDITTQDVVEELRRLIADDLQRQGKTPLDMSVLDIDVVLDALGLVYYEKKRRGSNG